MPVQLVRLFSCLSFSCPHVPIYPAFISNLTAIAVSASVCLRHTHFSISPHHMCPVFKKDHIGFTAILPFSCLLIVQSLRLRWIDIIYSHLIIFPLPPRLLSPLFPAETSGRSSKFPVSKPAIPQHPTHKQECCGTVMQAVGGGGMVLAEWRQGWGGRGVVWGPGGGGTGTYLSFRCNVGTVDVERGQKEGAYLSYMRSAGTRDESRLPTERPPESDSPRHEAPHHHQQRSHPATTWTLLWCRHTLRHSKGGG